MWFCFDLIFALNDGSNMLKIDPKNLCHAMKGKEIFENKYFWIKIENSISLWICSKNVNLLMASHINKGFKP